MPPKQPPTNLRFSFKKAVAEARRDFPKETAKTTFADLSTPAGRQYLVKWAETHPAIRKHPLPLRENFVMETENNALRNGFMVLTKSETDDFLLVFSGADHPTAMHFPMHSSQQFIFDHELGHIVAPGGLSALEKRPPKREGTLSVAHYGETIAQFNRGETVADTFAVLRGIQRGTLSREEIAELAMMRTFDSWAHGSYTHLTTTAIDALLAYSDTGTLATLTPAAQLRLTADHAAKYGLSAQDCGSLACDFYLAERDRMYNTMETEAPKHPLEQKLENLFAILSTAPENSATFYIAARVFQSTISKGYIDHVGKIETIAPGIDWDAALKKIDARAPEAVKTRLSRLPKPS
ncbi:MAG: hypothetical protein Q8K65_03240 [Alphaproteobacteria bacterium]|nr:hypothetical protein [Alphaproteobacteria bacterium]